MTTETHAPTTLIALLHGPDTPGIVARTAGWIYENGGNILHADQHCDIQAGVFIQRIEWQPSHPDAIAAESARFYAHATTRLGMTVRIARSTDRPRVAVLVSKQGHAYHDLMLRWLAGELPCEIRLVVSNHATWEHATREHYHVPFHHIPVTPGTKTKAEAQLEALLNAHGIQLVVMARYMQILSEDFLRRASAPVINIHHSFLPAFAGARPYHQAHARGVKLIGATAHYATPVLDEGPIIHQAVAAVSHRHDVNDLVRRGQDLEKQVLAQAVNWHLQNRVLAYGNKTVVFE
ncbi:MAG: formyltetrahydrofolate deformylase [Puniceicoccales bacterium]|jgi:formyltetrahydrofolate deformylase|nr:formyltetrahydrofolate deformylase [Puniceicoccales bacterium]